MITENKLKTVEDLKELAKIEPLVYCAFMLSSQMPLEKALIQLVFSLVEQKQTLLNQMVEFKKNLAQFENIDHFANPLERLEKLSDEDIARWRDSMNNEKY